jgi:hypothetical protein
MWVVLRGLAFNTKSEKLGSMTLIVKVIILRTLQEEANPASPAMLQDGHQMFPHPRHNLLALLLILDQSRHRHIAPF